MGRCTYKRKSLYHIVNTSGLIVSRGRAVEGNGCISGTILGYEEGLISRGLDIRALVYRVVIGVYYLDMRLVASLGIEFGGTC